MSTPGCEDRGHESTDGQRHRFAAWSNGDRARLRCGWCVNGQLVPTHHWKCLVPWHKQEDEFVTNRCSAWQLTTKGFTLLSTENRFSRMDARIAQRNHDLSRKIMTRQERVASELQLSTLATNDATMFKLEIQKHTRRNCGERSCQVSLKQRVLKKMKNLDFAS